MVVTYQGNINPDRPNLPFAQQVSITYQGNINPDRPNLPFAQSSSRSRGVYIVYWKDGGETEMSLTSSIADFYKNLGHQVVLKSTTTPTPIITTNGLSHDQVLQIIKSEYGDDITLLHRHSQNLGDAMTQAKEHRDRIESKISEISRQTGLNKTQVLEIIKSEYQDDIDRLDRIHTEQEGRITSGYEHRKSIEGKVEANISKFPDIHTKLQSLGSSLSDISTALEAHKIGHNGGGGCDCAFYDIPCQAECAGGNMIERFLPYLLIGGVAIYAVSSRRKRR